MALFLFRQCNPGGGVVFDDIHPVEILEEHIDVAVVFDDGVGRKTLFGFCIVVALQQLGRDIPDAGLPETGKGLNVTPEVHFINGQRIGAYLGGGYIVQPVLHGDEKEGVLVFQL